MAYQFDCIVEGCERTVEGDSEDEILEKVEQHRQSEHPDVDVDEQEVRNNIREV